jgi:hypothetical protein
MINRKDFFESVRRKFGPLSQPQVEGFNKILDEWERRKLLDLHWLAYILATAWHESAHTMQPVREMGGEEYLRTKPYYPWVGEGLIQVTWEKNARKFGATAPGQLMQWPIALLALFDGMIQGMFTGDRLGEHFHGGIVDWHNARKIVNGLDQADLIAGYGKAFFVALHERAALPAQPAPPAPRVRPVHKAAAFTTAVGASVAAVAHFLGNMELWYSIGLGVFSLALLAIGIQIGRWVEVIPAAEPPAAEPDTRAAGGQSPAPPSPAPLMPELGAALDRLLKAKAAVAPAAEAVRAACAAVLDQTRALEAAAKAAEAELSTLGVLVAATAPEAPGAPVAPVKKG